MFLIDADGNVVYSVFKETDFATSLANGPWSSSSLARVYNAARNASAADGPVSSDFEAYAPSNGAAASFTAIALRDWMGNVQGVLAFRMPAGRISATMQSRTGMGETGHTYLIGADFLMRNDLAMTPENDILTTRVQSEPVTRALAGETGTMIFAGHDGNEALAAYAPFTAMGTTWAIVAEQDTVEMLQAVDAMRNDLLLVSLGIVLVVSITGFVFSRSISKPLDEIQAAMGSVAERNYQTVIPGTNRQDEIGDISRALVEMQTKFEQVEADAQVSIFKGSAFDSCAAAMMMIDRDFRVTQANDASMKLLRDHRETLQSVWPSFSADDIVGTCIDMFHQNPDHQRRMLSDPSRLPHKADITVGDLKIELNISAIHDEDGVYVGNALEWTDVTEARTNSGILKSISENQCIVEYSLDGTILSANENFAALMGAPAAELCGRHHSEFVEPQEKGSDAYAEFWRDLKAGKFIAGKFTRVNRSGGEVTIRGSYNTIVDGNGAPYKIVEVATDITELNRVANERQLTLDAIGKMQAMIEFETDGTIRSANQNFLATTGYTLDEIVGKHHGMFMPEPERQSQDYRNLWVELAEGKANIGVFKRVGKDGNEIYLQSVYCPVPDASGNILRVIKCASDVTGEELERQRISEERATQEAAQAHVVSALSEGLGKLSAGDLTAIITEGFAADYEQLRFDFNAACEKLMSVMSEVALKTHGISSSAGQITQSADDLAKRTENQAASLEEIASAIEEMTASVKLATERAETAETATETAKRNAEVSESVVKETIEAMTQIDRSSEQISQIIGVIDDIAFQTNLLALNAGVEAARAGDAGRGFAVVASEVRALAQRCSDAAKEIKGLISESGEHVKHGVDLVGRTGTSLEEIIKSVVEVSGLVAGMFSSSKRTVDRPDRNQQRGVTVGPGDPAKRRDGGRIDSRLPRTDLGCARIVQTDWPVPD